MTAAVNRDGLADPAADGGSSNLESSAELSGSAASTRRLRIIFFGTPDFAAPAFERLLAAPDVSVEAAVSQPDRAVGRHAVVSPSAVSRIARDRGVTLLQPESIRGDEFAERVRTLAPDAIVVVAYGKILPPPLLAIPPLGAINVHGSLLPRHRGASPVQAAILAGDAVTGVAVMRMTEGLDEGPVYGFRETPIGETETAASLSARLAAMGSDLLVQTLRAIRDRNLRPEPQSGAATYCRPIRREDGRIDWTRGAPEILRMLRAYTPWPGVFTVLDGETVKVLEAAAGPPISRAAPGTILPDAGGFAVACGDGTSILPLRLQRAGRRPAAAAEFRRGLRPDGGDLRFG